MNDVIKSSLVSTIIPVYNRPAFIVEAVASVISQTYRPIEIIIIDDGSTDNTPLVLAELAEQHPEVILLSQQNAGPGVARELGRQAAQGEYIQYLDSDDLLFSNKFDKQVSALCLRPDCHVAYGKTESTSMQESLTGKAMRSTALESPAMFPGFLRSRWWGTSTPLYRASVLREAGAWLPTLNEEDWEYDCRVASLGGRLAFVDEFVAHVRRHDDHLSDEGSTDPTKLKHRCIAQENIYKHGLSYMLLDDRLSEITDEDWAFFSKSVFFLARQCAAQNLSEQALSMTALSIKAAGRANMKHRVFLFLGKVIGWLNTSKFISMLERHV